MTWFIYALLSTLIGDLVTVISKLGVKRMDFPLATTIQSTVTSVFLVISYSIMRSKDVNFTFPQLSRFDWMVVIGAGLVSGISWLLYFGALKHGLVSKVEAVGKLSIVFVVILSAMILGEQITIKTIIGAIGMAISMFLIVF